MYSDVTSAVRARAWPPSPGQPTTTAS